MLGALLAGIGYTALVLAPRGLWMERPVDKLERSPVDAAAEEAAELGSTRIHPAGLIRPRRGARAGRP